MTVMVERNEAYIILIGAEAERSLGYALVSILS